MSDIEVVVRCVSEASTDIHLTVTPDETVLDLKKRLQTLVANQPAPSAQRLIYNGACLSDDQAMREALSRRISSDCTPIVHLAIRVTASSPSSSSSSSSQLRQRRPADVAPVPPALPQTVDHAAAAAAYGAQYAAFYQQQYGITDPSLAAYYQQYYTNYVQMYSQSIGAGATTIGSVVAQPVAAAPDAAPVAAAAAANGGGPAAFGLNADAGEGAGGEGHDILALIYGGLRLVLLVSLLMAYASLERFLVVGAIGLFALVVRMRRQAQQRDAAAAAAALRQAETTAAEQQQQQQQRGEDNDTDESSQQQPQPQQQQQESVEPAPTPSAMKVFFSTCFNFFTSFFTSLVPDNNAPLPVDIN